MALSYDKMQQIFEQLGFKGFSMRPYDAEIENLISEATEDNAKAYMIDIVPGGIEYGQNKSAFWSVCYSQEATGLLLR